MNLSSSCTSFLLTCELIKLMHVFSHQLVNSSSSCTFFTNVPTYQALALCLPPCEHIRLTLFFLHRVNLSGSCTLFLHRVNLSNSCSLLFFPFFSPLCELISLMHSFPDYWHSDLYPTHARTLWFYETEWKELGNIATTKTMWYRNLA